MLSRTYCFDDFRLDVASRELWHGDKEVPLHRKAFDCIVYLLEHRERAVERDELFQAVWGDVHLSDNVLHQSIFEARRALHDTGEEQRFIKTVRAFGYRWAAPVDMVEPPGSGRQEYGSFNGTAPADTAKPPATPVETAQVPAATSTRFIHRPVWLGVALALLAVGALTGGTAYLSRDTGPNDSEPHTARPQDADIALLLPVIVGTEGHHAWMRLGLMDLIAERLRAAGQAMVPSDTVIALLRGHSPALGPNALGELTATTGADLVIGARAQQRGTRWWISLRSLGGAEPPITAFGEAKNALQAARAAADGLALSLGLAPGPESDAEPDLTMLLQRVTAARLAQRYDEARALIEAADPELRRHPEVRFRQARLDLASHELDAAQASYESLLADTPARRHPALRASILHCLGELRLSRSDFDAAAAALEEAARLLDRASEAAKLGRIHSTWGKVEMFRGNLEAARTHFARARLALEGTGDADGLADLDNYLGVFEALRGHYVESVPHFERAADRAAALHDLGSELDNRANLLYTHLGLLDIQAATTIERRVNELQAQASHPGTASWANLTRAYLLTATGRSRKARRALGDVLRTTKGVEDLLFWRMRALVLRAEIAARDGDDANALHLATEVVERVPPGYSLMAEERGRAWLIAVRAHLARGRRATATEAATALTDWAEHSEAPAPKIYAALARAELAAAENRGEAAEAAFEQALDLTDAGGVPLRLLRVAESYVSWLLTKGRHGTPDPQRALVVADRLAEYTDRHYGAALLQLRVQHAIGSLTAWRDTLADILPLAGEREIPPELLVAPQDRRLIALRP